MKFKANVSVLRSLLDYDPETGVFAAKVVARGRNRAGRKVGHVLKDGYVRVGVAGTHFRAHRLAWIYVYGEEPVGEIDHINGDRSDNRIANLRCVSRSANMQNHKKPKRNNKLGLLGVTAWRARNGAERYKATIVVGSYATPEEAHKAYLSAKRLLHSYFSEKESSA